MNFNDFGFRSRGRGRGRSARGKVNSVTVQKPLMPPPRKPAPRKQTTSSTTGTSSSVNVVWKNESSRSNVSTLVPTSTSFSTSDAESRVVIALSEGRGEAKHEVGIAAVDVSRPSLILCQISDSQSYINTLTKINILNPDEILIPMTFIRTDVSNRLTEKIKEHFKHVLITAVPRSTFDKTTGMQFVRELCAPEWNSVIILLQHRYYALAAASALFTYAERVLYVLYARESIKIEYQESEGFAFIDIATADKLELVASTSPVAEKKFTSLLSILNHCLTRIGSRMLRSSILQPPCSVSDIEARLDCVTELKRNPDLMASVQSILSKLTNVDQLLSVTTILPNQEINFSERQMNYILKLNVLLESISPLNLALKNYTLPSLVDLKEILQCPTFASIRKSVRDMIHSDAHPARGQLGIFQRCFAIKSDVNGLLDLVRKAYSERIEEMREYVRDLGTKYNLPLSVSHNNKKGFHIVFYMNQRQRSSFKKSELPDEFIQVDRLSTCVTMKTIELINWSTKIDLIQVEILKISNVMIYNLLLEVRQHIGLFYTLCEGIGKLDMLQSLAQASSTVKYVRPVFDEFLEVKDSRHPLLDFLCSAEPIPNGIFASNLHNVLVITGPNGSGKSIYIRQVLLLHVMAQVGSFVPAESATFRVCDRIFARISFDDNIEFGVSTFVLEIKEIEYFQTMMTKNTLIIIDELGRSTSVEEGTALAMAICEDFAKTDAFVFFATHFNAITRLEDMHLNITNWQLETYEEMTSCGRKKLNYTYNLIPGVTSLKNYGILCAKASWPEEIVSHAEKLLKNVWQLKPSIAVFEIGPDERLKYNLEANLKIAKLKKQLTATEVHSQLLLYVEEMNKMGWGINIADFTRDFPESDRTPTYLVNNTSRKMAGGFNRNEDNDPMSLASRFNESLQNALRLVPEVVYSQSVVEEAGRIFSCDKQENVPTTSIASRFNESLQNLMYLTPEVVYSQSVAEEAGRIFIFDKQQEQENYASQNYKGFPRILPSSSAHDTQFGYFQDLKYVETPENLKEDRESQITGSYSNISAISNLSSHLSNKFSAKSRQAMSMERDLKIDVLLSRSTSAKGTSSESIPWKEPEDSQKWHTASENSSNSYKSFPDVPSGVEYVSQDREAPHGGVANELIPTGKKIQIHSMYVFDVNNQLIQAVKAEVRRAENSTKVFSKSHEELEGGEDLNLNLTGREFLAVSPEGLPPRTQAENTTWNSQYQSRVQVSTSGQISNSRSESQSITTASSFETCNSNEIDENALLGPSNFAAKDERHPLTSHSICKHSPFETCNSKCEPRAIQSNECAHGLFNEPNLGALSPERVSHVKRQSFKCTENAVGTFNTPERHLSVDYLKRALWKTPNQRASQEQVLQSRHLSGKSFENVSNFIGHETQAIGLERISQSRHLSVEYLKRRPCLKTNEELWQTSSLRNTPNPRTSQEEVSQSRHLSDDYNKGQTFENAPNLIGHDTQAIGPERMPQSRHPSVNYFKRRPCLELAQAGSLQNTSNLGSSQEQVSQLRHLTGDYNKAQIFANAPNLIGHDITQAISPECISQSRHLSVDYLKCRPCLKTNEELCQTGSLRNTPYPRASQKQVSQSRRLSSDYNKGQPFENAPNLIEHDIEVTGPESQSRHLSVDYFNHRPCLELAQTSTLRNTTYPKPSQKQVSQSQHLSGDYNKAQTFENALNLNGHDIQAIGPEHISQSRHLSVDYFKSRSCLLKTNKELAQARSLPNTPNPVASQEQVSQSRYLTADYNKTQPFENAPNLMGHETQVIDSERISQSRHLSVDYFKRRPCSELALTSNLRNTPNPGASQKQVSQSRHLSDNYIKGQSAHSQSCRLLSFSPLSQPNCDVHESGANKESAKNLPGLTRDDLFHLEFSDDIIDTSQKTQLISEISGRTSCIRRKRFDFTEVSRSEIDPPKRPRLSLINPSDVVLDNKYEEIETFEDIGSCKPRPNANLFGEPIEDVSFDLGHNISQDIFSDLTVATSTPVNSSGDEFKTRRKFTSLRKKKFVPPKKLTKKEIQNDYFRQDLEMLNVKDETALMKYHHQILNRPSVRQLQQQRHLAVLRNTGEGIEVISAVAAPKRKRTGVPLQRRESATAFDIKLFSDKNSDKFEKFLERKKSQISGDFHLQIAPSTEPFGDLFSSRAGDDEGKDGDDDAQQHENSITNIVKKYLQDS